MVAGDGTVTPGNFATALLSALGKPTSGAWPEVINAWTRAEGPSGGAAWQNNNPLNVPCYDWDTTKVGCWTATNGRKFARYPNLETAVNTYVGSGLLGGPTYGYPAIRNATTPLDFANAITASKWDGGHYAQYTQTAPNGRMTYTGIAALVAQQNGNLFPVGGQSASGTPGNTSASGGNPGGGPDLNPFDWASGALGAFLKGLFGTAEGVILNLMVLILGVIFVVIGLWMLLRQEDSPNGAIKDMIGVLATRGAMGGMAEGVATAPSAPTMRTATMAGPRYKQKQRAERQYIGADIKVEDAINVPEQSPETPRVRSKRRSGLGPKGSQVLEGVSA